MKFDVFMLDGYYVGSFNGHEAQAEAGFKMLVLANEPQS
jgi:hypothetical protein